MDRALPDFAERFAAGSFPTFGLASENASGLITTVGVVSHARQPGDTAFSVRLAYMTRPNDYRQRWRHVDSRPSVAPLAGRERSVAKARSTLRRVLRLEQLTPRLLGESSEPAISKALGLQANECPVDELALMIDDDCVTGSMVRHGRAFGAHLVHKSVEITIGGRSDPETIELREVTTEELIRLRHG